METLKVLTTETVSDWYQNKWVEVDVKKYSYFTLEASEMRWDLKGHYRKDGRFIYDSFFLAPEFNTKSIVDKIDIREIIGNHYKKPIQHFK